MSSEPGAGDELSRWATALGPAVLARAQAEAVEVLRDALVDAALRSRQNTPASSRQSKPADQTTPKAQVPSEPDLLWAYCVLKADDPHPPDLVGVESREPVERLEAGGLAVLVSRVPSAEFGAEPLRHNLNDLTWLERVARAHEAVLDRTLADATIVPLRMCTIYETADSVRRMLERERASFFDALSALDDRFEWAVKVLIDSRRLLDAVHAGDEGGDPKAEAQERGEGSSYMLRRRSERAARESAATIARSVADDVHGRLGDWAVDAISRPPQNRDLSGHSGEMVLNAAYLVQRSRTDELRGLVAELEDRHRGLGVTIELTGPWPPYNFIPGDGAAALG